MTHNITPGGVISAGGFACLEPREISPGGERNSDELTASSLTDTLFRVGQRRARHANSLGKFRLLHARDFTRLTDSVRDGPPRDEAGSVRGTSHAANDRPLAC